MDDFVEVWTAAGCTIRSLADPRITVGRAATNDVVLADDAEVSRLHATFESVGANWVIRDLNSSNGTLVNGRRVTRDRPLVTGDEIVIGSARLVFRSAGGQPLDPTVGAIPAPSLTPRERDVLRALFQPATAGATFVEPASTREMAEHLFVSEAAVKQHLANLYDKFGIHSGLDRRRTRLANEALRRGAISLSDVQDRDR